MSIVLVPMYFKALLKNTGFSKNDAESRKLVNTIIMPEMPLHINTRKVVLASLVGVSNAHIRKIIVVAKMTKGFSVILMKSPQCFLTHTPI